MEKETLRAGGTVSGEETPSLGGLLRGGGGLATTEAHVDKHLSNPADGRNVVIISGLRPVTVITMI